MRSQRTRPEVMKERVTYISTYEPDVQAFIGGTFDSARVLDASARSDQNTDLAGLLLGAKDIINVDQFPTRCGSDLPEHLFKGPQASCVTRLLNAGAIMAGKTVTAEFAVSDPGPTRNPRNLDHTPGGSSSGSAAAVAAGFCDIALGTQTSGSVIRPAGYCGVVGYKPSFGRVALDGVLPYSKSMDHIGLFAKDMPTLAATLPILVSDWQNANNDPGNKPVIGVPRGSYLDLAKPHIRAQFETSIRTIEGIGCKLKPVILCEDIAVHNDTHDLIANAELYQVHKAWFKDYREVYKPKSREALEFGQNVSKAILTESLKQAQRVQFWMRQLMAEHAIDAWIAPVAPDLAPEGITSTGDFRMNAIWSYTGLPVITFPTGTNDRNLPYSVQIIGRFGQDETLLNISRHIHQLIGVGELPLAWSSGVPGSRK
ncbi:MAG: amidase [Paracoccaceae bacterium]|nr:amidase [Paracoccaceae bacterium]MDG1738601.1 amidase [Paracoccaceae bacterium]MDG2257605.1 amidase [Paracoccaceae bacterium]